MAFEHSRFLVDHRRDIDAKGRYDLLAEKILALERIAIVRVRNRIDWWVFVAAVKEIRYRGGEGCCAYDFARLFVVEVVIVRAVREDDVCTDAVDEPSDFLQYSFVVNHSQIAFFEAVIRRTNCTRSSGPFGAANAGDLFGAVFRRTAVAWCHRRDVDVETVFPLQPNERSRTKKLRIIGVGKNCKNNGSHKRFTL